MSGTTGNHDVIQTEWQGIAITIRYTPQRFAGYDHLEIVSRDKQRRPITETGYRSHFLLPEKLDEFGDPCGYVLAWLDHEGNSNVWRASVAKRAQLSLFG